MSNYQRLISYIYTYESGLKGKNVGFAKLETRNSQCRLTVNVKKVVPVGSPLGVYLLSGDGEQRIGTLFSRNGAGEFRALLNADRVEGSGRPLQEFFGLSIHEAENAGHSYTTIWEDAAMNAAEAVEEEEKNADRSQEKLQSRQEESTLPEKPEPGNKFAGTGEKEAKNPDGSEEKEQELRIREVERAEESGLEKESEVALEKQEKSAERSGKEELKIEGESAEAEREEIKPEEESAETEGEEIKIEEEKITTEEVQSRGEQEEAEEETGRETEQTVQQEKGEEQAEETKRAAVETAQMAPEREGKADEAGAQEKSGIRERLLSQNTLPPSRTFSSSALSRAEAGTEAITEARTEARTDRRSARPRSRRRPDGGMSAREWAENLAAPRGLNRDCKAEVPIKADDRAFIPLHELDDGCSHQRMWARLRRKYPKILAFDYEPGCEILTIKPQDIGLLPREAWIFGNNSFLLHGYYSYRYLILARLENPDGEPRYLLGVPGHYSSNEKYMESMFGFSDFIMSKKQPSGDDCFGYWYTDVRVGN